MTDKIMQYMEDLQLYILIYLVTLCFSCVIYIYYPFCQINYFMDCMPKISGVVTITIIIVNLFKKEWYSKYGSKW